MELPARLPGLRALSIALGVYSAVWIALEGALWRAAVMGVGTSAILAGLVLQRRHGGRPVPLARWVLSTFWLGLAFGFGCGTLTLLFMSVKTGLHAHGPEFSAEEITWVVEKLPFWSFAGAIAGAGFGLTTWRASGSSAER